MEERDHLVKMANQIAANFRYYDDGVERVADHLRRFWAPALQRQLQELVASGGAPLDDRVCAALQLLREQD